MKTGLLVPCYNAERFLPRLRQQVDRLSPAFDEVLLADDGSTDRTAAVAEDLGFRIVRLPANLGPGGARNALVRLTSSDWIHFHDVDDEISPDYLKRVIPYTEGIDAVFHSVDCILEESRVHEIRWQIDPGDFAISPSKCLLSSPMPTVSSFLRRDCFLSLGGFNERHRCFEDGDFNFRLALSCARIAIIPDVLECSLRHDGGIGADQRYCFSCRLNFLEEYAKNLSEDLYPTIAVEAERTAVELLRAKDIQSARRSIALARSLGRRVPRSCNPFFKIVIGLLPATTALRLQDRWRRR